MARESTKNLNLVKPDKIDQYDIADFNNNMDKIDNFAGLVPPKALTADKLTVGSKINGVQFDGSKDIVLPYVSYEKLGDITVDIPTITEIKGVRYDII